MMSGPNIRRSLPTIIGFAAKSKNLSTNACMLLNHGRAAKECPWESEGISKAGKKRGITRSLNAESSPTSLLVSKGKTPTHPFLRKWSSSSFDKSPFIGMFDRQSKTAISAEST
jgi:hypothetical protein